MKMSLILMLVLIAGCPAMAQQKKSTKVVAPVVQVPEQVHATFKNQFAVAENGQWKKTYRGNYVAEFTNANQQGQSVEYDEAGKVLKNKIIYQPDHIPQEVNTALKTSYEGAIVKECVRIELPGIKPYYKVKMADAANIEKELLISEEGTISE